MISLPIDPLIPQIVEAVRKNDRVILTATPGAGKTTRLPPELLNSVSGKIAVLEPRRIATIGAAQHIASERQWQLGSEVGYMVRFESKVSTSTRLQFMTDAILLRQLLEDPELKTYDLIVIDEFHERNLNQDLVLGIVKELQDAGRDIKLLVMSATLDVQHLQTFLPGSVHVEVPGKVFPLEIRHVTKSTRPITDHEFIKKVADTTLSLSQERTGDILVFLPGVGEISRLQTKLEELRISRDVLPLHGSLPLSEQKLILNKGSRPRVVLATNVAEASITVPGTDTVVDSGLARSVSVNLRSGFEKLELSRIALFNARQRAGRAARQSPGVCVRLWTTFEEASMSEQATPECQRADLSDSLLLLAHLGTRDFENFSWPEPPPAPLLNFALEFLNATGALDVSGRLTETGKELMRLPMPPRWGVALIESSKIKQTALGARISALLSEKGLLQKNFEIHSHFECDVTLRLQLLEEVESGRRPNGVNLKTADAILTAARQLSAGAHKNKTELESAHVRKILLLSQKDRLCRRRKEETKALMVGGRGVKLAPESQVKRSEFFVALQAIELPGQSDTTVSIACGFDKAFVLDQLKDWIEVIEDVYFDEKKGQFFSRRLRRFRDLDLDEPALTPVRAEDIGDKLAEALSSRWDWLAEQNETFSKWLQRWKFFSSLDPLYAAVLSDQIKREIIAQAAFGKTKVADVVSENWVQWAENTLDRSIVNEFNKQAPSHFTAATGNRYPIHYVETEPPYVEVRLQEMFGVTVNPRLGFGKVPLTFKLLAPNYRPAQVTSDIASFWKNTYFEVRKELRSRYPKHSWPDDPLTAPPVAKGPRRKT